jgi:replicative DNA helicase
MSVGLQVVRSIVDTGSRAMIRSLRAEWFLEDELPQYEFMRSFYRRYGTLPTADAFREQGMTLRPAPNPPGYYVDRIKSRAVYSAVFSNHDELVRAMEARNADAIRAIISAIYRTIQSLAVAEDTMAVQTLASLVMEDYEAARARSMRQELERDADGAIMRDAEGFILTRPALQGITTGYRTLDHVSAGLMGGDVATVVGRPGMGKSYTIIRMAVASWLDGNSVSFTTMEMTGVQTVRRVLGAMTGVNPDLIRRGQLSNHAEADLRALITSFPNMPAFHVMVGDLRKSVDDVDAHVAETQPDSVYIDASYLLQPETGKLFRGKRWEALAEVGEAIKGIAIRRDRPIVQTVQFNRSQKEDEAMTLDNIGGTDVIGQVSTLVIGLKGGEPPNETTQRRYAILKNRDGENAEFTTHYLFNPLNLDEVVARRGDFTINSAAENFSGGREDEDLPDPPPPSSAGTPTDGRIESEWRFGA